MILFFFFWLSSSADCKVDITVKWYCYFQFCLRLLNVDYQEHSCYSQFCSSGEQFYENKQWFLIRGQGKNQNKTRKIQSWELMLIFKKSHMLWRMCFHEESTCNFFHLRHKEVVQGVYEEVKKKEHYFFSLVDSVRFVQVHLCHDRTSVYINILVHHLTFYYSTVYWMARWQCFQ